jgi:hypothetical protein
MEWQGVQNKGKSDASLFPSISQGEDGGARASKDRPVGLSFDVRVIPGESASQLMPRRSVSLLLA